MFLVLGVLFSSVALAQHSHHASDEPFDATALINSHVSNSHDYHLWDWNGHPVSLPLPIILYTDKGLVTFLSSEFHHDNSGEIVVEKNGEQFVKVNEQIRYKDASKGRPLDFSITKNVVVLMLAALLMLCIFMCMASSYKKNDRAQRGLSGFLEPLVLFVRDDIAKPNIGHHYERYMPYLLTVFFLIWIGNLLGLLPIVSGTLTNDIVFTGTLAVITFLITTFSANKNYWKHIFATPGVPMWLAPIMIPVEVLGMFTKPFALMVRLFANITAGHIIILSLISLIFIFKTLVASVVSVPFALFINVLELLVAFIQAYVFTLFSALFIGTAIEEEHH